MSSPRPIRLRLSARVVAPLVALILLWVAATAVILSGTATRWRWLNHLTPGRRDQIEAAVIGGAGILIALVMIMVVSRFASRVAREVTELAEVAGSIANGEANGDANADATAAAGPSGATRTREVSEAVDAITRLRDSFADATVTQSRLRDGLRQILISLGRRNSSLLHRQLRIIDDLENQAVSPQALSDLFSLDHLTTRMRRHAESLTIVAGGAPARAVTEAVPVVDVIRAAAAEVEDYKRVTVITDAEEALSAPAVTDMIHLLAELIENATLFSPSNTRVEVRAGAVANGFAIEIEDRGLGIAPEQLEGLNARLTSTPDLGLADADRLGLFVVGTLAARHGIQVSLCPSAYRGTKAVIVLPDSVVVLAPAMTRPSAAGEGDLFLRRIPPRSAPRNDQTAATTTVAPRAPAAQGGSGAPIGLPRRVRTEATAANHQGAAPEPTAEPAAAAPTPEHARNLAASLQQSWQRSRDTGESEGRS